MINPGDIVLADQAGIVVVPQDHAEEVSTRLVAFKERNRDYLVGVTEGKFSNEWVDEVLAGAGWAGTTGSK